MNCCVCYEEKEVYYDCKTCEEGKICLGCCLKLNCQNIEIPRDLLLKSISCPCCRTHNWKIVFDCVLARLTRKHILDYYHHPLPLHRFLWEVELLPELSQYPKQYKLCYRKNGKTWLFERYRLTPYVCF
jgi:hypothetical protein